MADTPRNPDTPDFSDIPDAAVAPKARRSIQLVWLIPIVAALVGGWLAVKAILDKGPTITITFETAEGLEAGKTKIKYKDVEVGLVQSVSLAGNGKNVLVTAEMVKQAEPHLRDDTRFWVVRPRISGGTVTGLGTLLSGSYIGVDIGKSGNPRHDFVGLEIPPIIRADLPGREFVLHSDNLGSLDVGSPIFFRRLQAGLVAAYELDKDGGGVTIQAFINAPYDKFVTPNTRFWHASGIDITLDASGVKVETQSMISILVGGLAFETPIESVGLDEAAPNTRFNLFDNRTEAMKNPEQGLLRTVMVFHESVRGLTVGAPIDFRGIGVGQVTGIKVDLNEATDAVDMLVEADLYPARLRARLSKPGKAPSDDEGRRANIDKMTASGFRAQLRTGNLLTGQLYVALDHFPDAPKVRQRHSGEIVTVPSSTRELQTAIASIAAKVQAFPLEEIGADLRKALQTANRMIETDVHQTLQSADRLLQRLDSDVAPEARAALAEARKAIVSADHALRPDSPLQSDAREAMREIARAAAAFRVLADYLDRHPEALVTGKKEDRKEDRKDDSKEDKQ